MAQSRYQDLCKAFAEARANFAAYRSECFFFAATFARGFGEYAGWPREAAAYEPVAGGEPTARIEDAMTLDRDGFWRFGFRLTVDEPKGKGTVLVPVRFKKLDTRYIISLFGDGAEDFEVPAPTPRRCSRSTRRS